MARETQRPTFENLRIEYLPIADLAPDPRNARKHPQAQILRPKAGIQ